MQRCCIIFVFLLALVGCQNSNPCGDLMRENFELNEWILEQEIRIDQQDREIQRLQALADAAENFEEQADGLEPPAVDFGGGDDGGGAAPAFPRPGDPGNPLDDEVPAPPFNPGGGGNNDGLEPPAVDALNDDAFYEDALEELDMILPGLESRPGAPVDAIGLVQSIAIDPRRTRAFNLDGSPGDDGLVVVFEPRDADDRPLAALGEITIVAVDPALPEHQARVARWDYNEKEARDLLVQTRQGPKIVCQLLWPKVPPDSSRLQLYVRMKTGVEENGDERSCQADMPLLADFAGADRGRFARVGNRDDYENTRRVATPAADGPAPYDRSARDNAPIDSNSAVPATPEAGRSIDSYNSAPPAYEPRRRVTLPGADPPAADPPSAVPLRDVPIRDIPSGDEPIRTSRAAPPPWSPTRN